MKSDGEAEIGQGSCPKFFCQAKHGNPREIRQLSCCLDRGGPLHLSMEGGDQCILVWREGDQCILVWWEGTSVS